MYDDRTSYFLSMKIEHVFNLLVHLRRQHQQISNIYNYICIYCNAFLNKCIIKNQIRLKLCMHYNNNHVKQGHVI